MEEIGKFTNLTKMGVNKIINNFLEETEKFTNPPESIRKDDVWNFSACNKSYGFDFPGRIPGQIVENLAMLITAIYTHPHARLAKVKLRGKVKYVLIENIG